MPERFVKVDLTKEECEAVHEVCDLANVMLNDLAHSIPRATRDALRTRLNSVRYKMGAAATLFGPAPNIITGTDTDALSLHIAKKIREQ